MDLTILAIVFFGSNLLGMYNYVPFTNINPTSTFLQRGIGSFQLTSAVYALQELGDAAFPDVRKERDQVAIKHALDEYMSARNNATIILPTRSDSVMTPTTTTTTFVDTNGTIRSQAIANKIREHLHPKLDTHNGIVNAVWEALAFALLGFTILCIIWKELTKSHESSPKETPEKSSSSMVVKQLLKDRLSFTTSHGHQNAAVSNDNELPGFLSQLASKLSGQFASLESRLGDVSQSFDRVANSGFETIRQQLETICNKQSTLGNTVNDVISPDALSSLLDNLGDLIKVQKDISGTPGNCGFTPTPEIQIQINETKSQVNRLKETKVDRENIENDIMQLKTDVKNLKESLQSCDDDSIKQRLQALEGQIPSLNSATTRTPFNSENIRESINEFRQKQEDLEKRLEEVEDSNPATKFTAAEQNWGQSFQRLEDRMSRIENSLNGIQTRTQNQGSNTITKENAYHEAIQNLEKATSKLERGLKEAQDSHASNKSSIEGQISLLQAATANIDKQTVEKNINTLRQKQEELEKRLGEIKDSNTDKSTAVEQNWEADIQRLNDIVSEIRRSLEQIQTSTQNQDRENDTGANCNCNCNAHYETIQKLERGLKEAENSHANSIKELRNRIYNYDGKFSNQTKPKDMSLEELARLFRNLNEHFQVDMEWVKSRVTSVSDNSDRVSRMENVMRDTSRHLDKCMKKLGIKFEIIGADDPPDQPVPIAAQAPNAAVQQRQSEPKEENTKIKSTSAYPANSNRSTVDSSTRVDHGNSTQTPSPAKSRSRTSQPIGSWADFAQNAHDTEKAEADKRQAEEDSLRAQGNFTTPQLNLKETYIRGDPKDDEDYSQAEKTEHKIGDSSPSVAGINQSRWATPSPVPASTTAPKNAGGSSSSVAGINQSRWATPSPVPASNPAPKNAGDSKPRNWAESPSFTPAGSKQQQSSSSRPETPTTAEMSPKIPTGPKQSNSRSGWRRKSSAGLQGSVHAPPSTSDDSGPPGQSRSGLMAPSPVQRVRKETSGSFSGFPKSNPAQSPSGKDKGPGPSGLQESIHAQPSTKSNEPASPVENKDKQKPKDKASDLSGINQSRWADK